MALLRNFRTSIDWGSDPVRSTWHGEPEPRSSWAPHLIAEVDRLSPLARGGRAISGLGTGFIAMQRSLVEFERAAARARALHPIPASRRRRDRGVGL